MNKNITKPLIIQFTPEEVNPAMKSQVRSSSRVLFIPVNTPWNEFRDKVLPLVGGSDYDSVLVHTKENVDRDKKGVVGNMAVKLNALAGAGTRANKPVLSYESSENSYDKPFYLANPSKPDMKAAGLYAPSDETIMGKYNSYRNDAAWQEHQDKIWGRMKDMMPLSRKADQFNRDHASQLKDPKRGLEEKDLDKFWSFKARQGLSPTIMGDDMVGMPSVEGRDYEGFTMSVNKPDGTVETKPLYVRSLMTIGASGIAIPMANADGFVNKHQIAADLTAFGTALHFRAADGKTVAKGELFDKKTREYDFKFENGEPAHLKVADVAPDNTITMQDNNGIFNVKSKKEIIDVLKERGYVVPDIITSVKAEQDGKYIWQSPGTMTGSESVIKTVSPSNPGFIKAREPKNGDDQYVVLVAEGALKGHIVAKYVDVTDEEGACFGDKIAGDKGIIVAQVPGVAESYVKNVVPIYEKYNIAETYIAMDADGRKNRNVALGIHNAYNFINKVNPTTVLSWDPEQKGLDDALLAVAQGKITIKDMDIAKGTAEELFPVDNAEQMTPYKLDGSQTKTPSWMQEYDEQKKDIREKVAKAQAATAARLEQNKNENEQKTQWVETPADISNLQNSTIAKAADMAEAIAGNLPPLKQEPKEDITDIDQAIADMEANGPDMDKADEKTRQTAKEWDAGNPAMNPIKVPHGYEASYIYEQPIVHIGSLGAVDLRSDTSYRNRGEWGVVSVKTNYEMSIDEKAERQNELKNSGMECVGNMRLTSQTFKLDKENAPVENLDDPLKM